MIYAASGTYYSLIGRCSASDMFGWSKLAATTLSLVDLNYRKDMVNTCRAV